MSRKGHVQFQGECGGVILQSYPARMSNHPILSNNIDFMVLKIENLVETMSKFKVISNLFAWFV